MSSVLKDCARVDVTQSAIAGWGYRECGRHCLPRRVPRGYVPHVPHWRRSTCACLHPSTCPPTHRTQDEKGRKLVSVTEAALEAGIAACGPGRPFRDIGKAIHELLRGKDYSVSSAFTGHGIGQDFHRRPWIHHVCKCCELLEYSGVTKRNGLCSKRRAGNHAARRLLHHRGLSFRPF